MNAPAKPTAPVAWLKSIAERVRSIVWEQVSQDLDSQGSAMVGRLLSPDECRAISGLYTKDEIFRSRVVMTRHGFGRGEYKYFSYPLPDLIARLRTAVYPHLVPIANRWNKAMAIDVRYPDEHGEFLARCHQAGQIRPTPLLLRYGADDYNCLHQDLYGEHVMPLRQGDGVVFAVHNRPVQGTRGVYRVNLRHGVSRIRSGHRHTLGIIFHDAQ